MRTARITYPGAEYHVMSRITRQEMIFENEYYKYLFLDYMARAKKKYPYESRSVSIMDNHFHMIIKPLPGIALATIMKSMLGGFALRFNKIMGYKGPVWQGRFKSKIIDTMPYLGKALAYIANNPVRAGIVKHPLEYKFSSFTAWNTKNPDKQYKPIRDLFLFIVNKPSKEIFSIYSEYLNKFDLIKAKNPQKELTFRDKSPGRPRKK